MKWEEVRAEYPNEWLVVEAIRFHEEGEVFVGDDITVAEKCPDGAAAFAAYRRLHQAYPAREFLFVHTSRPDLRVEERRWMGIRPGLAITQQGCWVNMVSGEMRYPVVIHKDPDSDYSVTFPDLPGCFTAGKTIEEAMAMAVEAMELHIEGCLEEGIAVADPSPIAALRDAYAGGTWALVQGNGLR